MLHNLMTVLRSRENARLGDPVRLTAQFFSGGVLFDPPILERVEIYRSGDGVSGGGTLVDTVDPVNVFQTATGLYYIDLDLFSTASPSPASVAIVAQTRYYDVWVYREQIGGIEVHSVGLSFYLYPAYSFVCDDTSKFRFEMKPDRKRIVKGENLDIRLQIIPIPLYRAKRDPIVDYLLPISIMRCKIIDLQNNEITPWTVIRFTGKEGILPTSLFQTLQLGEYHLVVELILPNGQSVRYPRQPVMLID